MRAVIQRVRRADVSVNGETIGQIGAGFLVLLGISPEDTEGECDFLLEKTLGLRVFEDEAGKMNRSLIDCGGGMCVVCDGQVLSVVPLPIAGLMDDKPVEEIGQAVAALEEAWKEIGCTMPSPFMTMALIPLACLPELRLTDRGLVDCNRFCFVDIEL